ncbi:gamma-glutamyltransferase [bacterium]|nr:gamma-glutamyltransferase [bacterium]
MFLDSDKLKYRNQNRSEVVCQNGIVCSSQPLASFAGINILKAGGNAIDAAVCANAMLSLVEPMSCGPGGDLFAIVWIEKEKKLFGINASGRAPYNWNLDEAQKLGLKNIPQAGVLSWSVPGCISGWDALLKRFGRFGFDKVLEEPAHYSREGFPVSPIIARGWSIDPKKDTNLAKTYMPEGKAIQFGDIFKNPDLAKFFDLIAEGGADAFYRGEIAEKIVKFSNDNGGKFSMRDFNDHKITWTDPVSSSYRGYDVWELPPNGQGISVLQMLNILENFDIPSLKPNSYEHMHLLIEAKKLAFEDRAVYYADMDFAKVPVEELLSKEYANKRKELIKNNAGKYTAGEISAGETIYLTVADKDGNMISFIQSNYRGMGSGMVPPKLGFMLQDRGELFTLEEGKFNTYEPKKRPFHTIIPAFITKEGKPFVSFGVMGGDFQPQGHVQIVMNLVDFGMNLQEAGDAPRIEHSGSSSPTGEMVVDRGEIKLESGFTFEAIKKLISKGHKVGYGGYFGGYQAIMYDAENGVYFGASESRKDGHAAGY